MPPVVIRDLVIITNGSRCTVFRAAARVALTARSVGRNPLPTSKFLPKSFRHLPSQLPVGLFRAADPPVSLRCGLQPAYPIVPLIPAKSRSPQIQSRRGLHRKAGSPCLTRAFELGHRPVSAPSSRRHHAIGQSPLSAPPGRCRSTLSLGPSRRRSCKSAWRLFLGAFGPLRQAVRFP